jgi:hypothetical protein
MGLAKWKITPLENLEDRTSRDHHSLSNWSKVCRDKKHLVRSRIGPPDVVGRGPRRLGEPVQGVGASCQVFCVRPCGWVRGRVRGRGWPSTNSAAAESPQLAPAPARNFNNHRHRLHLLRRAVEHSYRHPDPRTATTLSCLEPEMALIELPTHISLS